jgi:hypothetical protein
MGMNVLRPLTFILSPGGGEEFLLVAPSPLWGEGSGEGTFEAMSLHLTRLYYST